MQVSLLEPHWLENNKSIYRQLIALVISALIVALLLLIPVRMHFGLEQQTAIEVELTKVKPDVVEQTVVQPAAVEVIERVVQEPPVAIERPQPIVEAVPKIPSPTKVTPPQVENSTKLPSSAVILNSAYGNVKLYDLGEDFQVESENPQDFKFKQLEQPKWNQVTKLIDEDLDKPRVHMNFYSKSIVGSTERLFDKITYKKRFTTKYGTKIDCILIGLMPICGWK